MRDALRKGLREARALEAKEQATACQYTPTGQGIDLGSGRIALKVSNTTLTDNGETPQSGAVAVALKVLIKEECVEEFIQVMTEDCLRSREEAGCLRFEFLRDTKNPSSFLTYEVFASEEASAAHREMPHVKAWGAFQYGEKKPVLEKSVFKGVGRNMHTAAANPDPANSTAVLLQAEIKAE